MRLYRAVRGYLDTRRRRARQEKAAQLAKERAETEASWGRREEVLRRMGWNASELRALEFYEREFHGRPQAEPFWFGWFKDPDPKNPNADRSLDPEKVQAGMTWAAHRLDWLLRDPINDVRLLSQQVELGKQALEFSKALDDFSMLEQITKLHHHLVRVLESPDVQKQMAEHKAAEKEEWEAAQRAMLPEPSAVPSKPPEPSKRLAAPRRGPPRSQHPPELSKPSQGLREPSREAKESERDPEPPARASRPVRWPTSGPGF